MIHSVAASAQTSIGKWKCKVCDKHLSSKRSYEEHLNIHSETRPFECQDCDYAAASQMTLRRHILRKHRSKNSWGYQCPYCPEQYMEPASYQHHVVTKHMGRSATFGCPVRECSFTTKSSKNFRSHYSRHVIPYPDGTPRQFYLRENSSIARFLVNDDCGAGFGKRVRPPIIHRVKDVTSVARDLISSCSTSRDRCRSTCTPIATVKVGVQSSLAQKGGSREVHRPRLSLFEDDDLMKAPIKVEDRQRILPSVRPIRRKVERTPMYVEETDEFDDEPSVRLMTESEKVYIFEDEQFHMDDDGNDSYMEIADEEPGQIYYVPCIVDEPEPTSSAHKKPHTQKHPKPKQSQMDDFDLD